MAARLKPCTTCLCLVRADKGHTCERTRNPDGSLSGADRSTSQDAQLWDQDDVFRYSEVVATSKCHCVVLPESAHFAAHLALGAAAQTAGLHRRLRQCCTLPHHVFQGFDNFAAGEWTSAWRAPMRTGRARCART